MSNNETAALPLQALYELHTAAPAGREGMPAFAAELAKRLAQGRDAEVADFLRDSSSLCQERLRQLPGEHAPWQRDHALWLALARISLPLGQFYGGNPGVPRRSAELTAELTALARAWLDDWGSRTHQPWRLRDGYDLVLRQVFGVLGHEGMSSADITGLLRWARELSAKAGIAPGAQYYCQWQHLLHQLPEPELLAMAIEDGGGQLSRDIVQRQLPLQRTRPAAQRWALWRDFFAQFPAVLDQLRLPEPVLIASRWETADAARRDLLAQDLFKALCFASDDDWPHDRALVERMLQTDAAPLAAWFKQLGHLAINPAVAQRLWEARWPALLPLLLPACADGCKHESDRAGYAPVAETLLADRPGDLARLAASPLTHLLPALRVDTLQRLLSQLGKAASGSASKGLRAALAQALSALPVDAPQAAGWLAKPNKNLVLAYRDVLLAHPDPASGSLLSALLSGGLLDVAEQGPVQARLKDLGAAAPVADAAGSPGGEAVPAGSDAGSLAELEAQAASLQRLSPAIAALDQPALLDLLAPLSAQAARALLHLAASSPQELPALAHQLLAQAGAENRARLALALVQHWVAADGAPESRWVLKLLPGAADDRIVDVLSSAALAWHKTRKERAVVALQQLGRLDTVYALSCVQALATGKTLKPSVLAAAQAVLAEAATRRGMALADLGDELTPDFDLGRGVQLQVGAQTYEVLLQGDLSLRLRTPAGKLVRSLPALADEGLRTEWDAAAARLKTLSKGIKAVLQQQAPRLQSCLMLGRHWPLDTWRRLFLEHPLLRVVAQGLVWRVEPAAGQPFSLRIAEDLSLVDAESDAVQLPAEGRIALWHPAQATEQEHAQWRECLADYGLKALIEQVDAPADLPLASQWQQELLQPLAPIRLTQQALDGLAGPWRFHAGPVCDGPGIYLHLRDFAVQHWRVELLHSAAMPYYEPGHEIDIEGFALRDMAADRLLPPAEWPLPLQASLCAMLQALASRAAGAAAAQV
ncbi:MULTISPECIES: DUF4132 domain-containing protein [Delftia]|uniref:DUF4132 domain-containing protein n=1 Tax=Delftia TaxID=80865 RepID=UPI000F84638D|nr:MULTISPECIES: DUF4132 domain-containing protein [Delftia]WEL96285.1 DUF4132 domain-containing protein [Delftia tsuruhatensis]WQM85635.1 DUF4132 domain-containing protein [Delftia tsuruhatensis]